MFEKNLGNNFGPEDAGQKNNDARADGFENKIEAGSGVESEIKQHEKPPVGNQAQATVYDLAKPLPLEQVKLESVGELVRDGFKYCTYENGIFAILGEHDQPEAGTDIQDKFVVLEMQVEPKGSQNTLWLVGLPRVAFPYHKDIVAFIKSELPEGTVAAVRGGGNLTMQGETIVLTGSSGDYGVMPPETSRAMKNYIRICQQFDYSNNSLFSASSEQISELTHRVMPAWRVREVDKAAKERFGDVIAKMPHAVERAMYGQVCANAVRLGYDQTSLATVVEGREDVAYMLYSSENGSSFGFDTLYVGRKTPEGYVVTAPVARERWYINGITSDWTEDGKLVLSYEADGQTKTVQVDLARLGGDEIVSSLSNAEEDLVKMYGELQAAYSDEAMKAAELNRSGKPSIFHGSR
jgi:hypothetical protein